MIFCARATRPLREDRQGAPMLVLCSRNARPEKGLVRRPHIDQHGCPLPREEKQASLGRRRNHRLPSRRVEGLVYLEAIPDPDARTVGCP
jgi:hypothetical protein